MFYFIYDILLFLVYLIYLPVYAFRGRLHSQILTRLGFFKKSKFKVLQGKDVIWIHAVSVGEARIAESLVRLIRQQWPQKRIVVSTVTPTGHALLKRMLEENEIVFYAPVDISFVVTRFLSHIVPCLLIIVETEIWPNLIRLAKRHGASVIGVNGRISDRSYRAYRKFKPILKHILGDVDLFCMQTDEAACRIIDLGALSQRVKMTGNIKFDITCDWKESPVVTQLKSALRGCLLLIAGSTHENEEEIVVGIYKSLRKDFVTLRLLIAPRHLERLDKIRRMIRLLGLESLNLSRLPGGKASLSASKAGLAAVKTETMKFSSVQVMLVDTIGDLNALYGLCDVAFVGGSLVKKGGHNLIEPALFGKPIIFGKHMYNFKEIRDIFIREKAAVEIGTPEALEYELRRLLSSPVERKALGDRARELLDKNKGAAQRIFSEIQAMVKR